MASLIPIDRTIMTDKDAKLHNSLDWMTNAYLVQGKEVGEIANELNISTKLVMIKLKEHGLI
jgi:hypothetical protein